MSSTRAPEDSAGPHRGGVARLKSLLPIGVLLLLYLIAVLVVLVRLGFLSAIGEVVFSTPDSVGYRLYADFLAGTGPAPRAPFIGFRPFLFPLFLATYRFVGVEGFVALQLLLNLVTIAVTFRTLAVATRSTGWGIAGAVVLIIHPTVSLVALHALTETLSLALVALVVNRIVAYFRCRHRRDLLLSCFFLALAACTRPVFVVFFGLWALVAGCRLIRGNPRPIRGMIALMTAVSPVALQLVLTTVATGAIGVSSAGRVGFEHRFFPAVYGFARTGAFLPYNDPRAEAAKTRHPDIHRKIEFLLRHPTATGRAVAFLVKDNLIAPSSFTGHPGEVVRDRALSRFLTRASVVVNSTMAMVHPIALITLLTLFLVHDPDRWMLISLETMVASILLLSALSYWQGDRLIVVAVPALAVVYGLIGSKIPGIVRDWENRRRVSAHRSGEE